MAVGSYIPLHSNAELLNVNSNQWEIVPDYPYCDNLFDAPILFYDGKFTVFGGGCLGDSDDTALTAIVTFDPESFSWTKVRLIAKTSLVYW